MSFQVTPTTDPARKDVTCNRCGDTLPAAWESERDPWTRAHVCIRAVRLSERTEVR
jgi:hypothetical protein